MKAGVLGSLAGALLATVTVLWSCTVDRASEDLKCASQADCGAGRICQSGYCIVGTLPIDAAPPDALLCPSACNGGCDLAASPPTCTITGTGSGNLTCPAPFACSIACPTPGACGAINCGQGASCDVDCTADNACLAISCTTKNCDITCTGTNACGNISCTSGTCTAACTGAGACGNQTCTTGTCTQTCSGGNGSAVCGSLTCSSDGDCTRTCTGAGACATMTCNGGACIETCSGGSAACGPISCGEGRCLATCQGADPACGSVTCTNSCQCDVECDGTTNACPNAMACPRSTGQQYCTDTMQQTGRCDADFQPAQCKSCQ